jgi:hypothetical protein
MTIIINTRGGCVVLNLVSYLAVLRSAILAEVLWGSTQIDNWNNTYFKTGYDRAHARPS